MHPCVGADAGHAPQRPKRLNSERGTGEDGRWHGGDGGDRGQAPSRPARNCRLPERQAQAWTHPFRESQAETCRAALPLLLPWDGNAADATQDPPAKRRQTLLSASPSPGSPRFLIISFISHRSQLSQANHRERLWLFKSARPKAPSAPRRERDGEHSKTLLVSPALPEKHHQGSAAGWPPDRRNGL